ncbi:hypothetical protein BJ944DRAFT_164316 [Cunninghamella echinulata]|nr:hypothetical protein BJ944DRAFT_164316 [Cunninghamella echinulata]
MTNNNENTNASSVLIDLQIKSLEQRTHSVTVPRNSSVLELKNQIQSTLDVESGRQRLIFQGKVLKDDKNLMDYANLDNGKVIHLVIRPLDAPRNPQNDEPRPTNRRYYGHRNAGRSPFSSLGSRLPAMEGYTLITLDAQLDSGDNTSFISSIINGIANANPFLGALSSQYGRQQRSSTFNSDTASSPSGGQQHATSLLSSLGTRSPFDTRRSADSPNTNSTDNTRQSLRIPFPSSVEMRLSRTVAYIRNVRNILDAPMDQSNQIPYTSASSPELIQEIRSTLRGNGNSQTHQVGTVMNDMADLMEQSLPWLREIATTLQNEPLPAENEVI